MVYWLIGEVVPYTGFAQFDLAAQHSVESYRGHTRRFLGQRQREIHFHGSIKNERWKFLYAWPNFLCFDKDTCNICLHSMCFLISHISINKCHWRMRPCLITCNFSMLISEFLAVVPRPPHPSRSARRQIFWFCRYCIANNTSTWACLGNCYWRFHEGFHETEK